jgi:hypothetical protein
MTKVYPYQDLDLFFEQFRSMPEYLSLDQVKQFVQHPKPRSSFHLKGRLFRLWAILLTVATVITISTILYFFAGHQRKYHKNAGLQCKHKKRQ